MIDPLETPKFISNVSDCIVSKVKFQFLYSYIVI